MIITLAAVDNHPIVLHGIGAVLREREPDIALIAVAESVDELLAGPGADAQVVLLDLGMPEQDPPEVNIERLSAHGCRVLIYTSEERPVPVRRAIEAGAAGLLLKIDPVQTIARAVRDVAAGELACSGPLAFILVNDPDVSGRLSPRQVEILRLVSEGLPYKSVAKQLDISAATVREHLTRAVASYRSRGEDPGNTHGLVMRARAEGYLDA